MITNSGIGTFELLLLAVVAGGILLITLFTSRRWLWSCGLVGCVAVAVANTPADPVSTIVVALQLCALYFLSAFAWNVVGRISPTNET